MKSFFLNSMFFLSILSATTRGVFEGLGNKQIGYAVQLICGLLFIATLLTISERIPVSSFKEHVALFYSLFLVSAFSALYVSVSQGFYASWTYIAVMSYYYVMFFVYCSFQFSATVKIRFIPYFTVLGLTLVAVAILQQQFEYLGTFPGSDLASMSGKVRPSSLTGSYLHYPLVISILFFMLAQACAQRRSRLLIVATAILGGATIASYSRSGVMILGLGLCAYFVISSSFAKKLKMFVLGFVGVTLIYLFSQNNIYLDRILNATNSHASGNEIRIEQWGLAIKMWSDSPLLIGNYTGRVTNVTSNFSGTHTIVVESGALQQLLNFGLIGVVLFYGMFFLSYRGVSRQHLWIRAGVIAAVLESLIFQSIEVFPFMTILSMAPFYSHHLAMRAEEGSSN